MPLKIKLPTPITTANIPLTSLAEELAKSTNGPRQSPPGRDATDEASGFPLPPLPHQGRNHADFPSDVGDKYVLTANDTSRNDGMNHDTHASMGYLQPKQLMPPPPTEFDFADNNFTAGQYNDPVPLWQQQHQQRVQQVAVNDPIKIDFLPPPIHVPKNAEKGSDSAAKKNNDVSTAVPGAEGHGSTPNSEEGNPLNHVLSQQQQQKNQQQHPILPPLPNEGMEKATDTEKESEMLESSKPIDAATPDGTGMQQSGRDTVPLYAYNTLHQQKSWNKMVELLTIFTEMNGHSNVEMDNVNISADCVNRSSGEDGLLLMMRSWVRELRYIRHADDSGVDNNNAKKRPAKQRQMQQQRCDSENLTSERISELDKLSFPWKNDQTQWQTWLDDLLHHRVKNNGDCNVPVKFPEHPALGNFVNRQRVEYKKMRQGKPSAMTNAKIQDLERIGFVWSVREGGRTSWDDRFAELVAYQREKGNTLVPKKYPANPPLGYWVNEQRFQYQRFINGKSSTMNKERQESMDSINFKWSIRESPREFSEWINLLKEYKIQWGHCNVPLKYEQDASLGAFVNNARTQYKKFRSGLTSNMTQEKINQLEEIGFVWNVREGRTPWLQRFEELKEYKEKYGDCNVPKKWTENQKLSNWVTKQRSQYKIYTAGHKCNLTREKVDKLTELGLFQPVPVETTDK